MEALARRDDTSCEGSKQYYVCSVGNFRGCCASDPCTSGVCPNGTLDSLGISGPTSSTTSKTSSLSTSTISPVSSTTDTTDTTVSYTSFSTTASVSSGNIPTTTGATGTEPSSSSTALTATSSVAAVASNSTQSSSKAPIIGGVIGGIAALINIILLFWFCRRRRKRHGKSYTVHLRRSPSSKSLHTQEMTSVSKTELSLLDTNSTKPLNESHHGIQPTSPPSKSNLLTPGSTTALSLNAPTLSPDPSEFSTLSSGILSTSSGGFVRLPPLRMPPPIPIPTPSTALSPNEMLGSIPQTESHAAELSDTGFYRQRAELAAHSQREPINIPPERRRRNKSSLNPGHSWESSPSSSSGGNSGDSSPRSAVDKNGSSTLMSRATVRRVITRDGVVLVANLDRYSTVRDPERGGKGTRSVGDPGQEHVMSFMTFGGSAHEIGQRSGSSPGRVNGSVSNGGESGSATRLKPETEIVLEMVGASPVGEALPAYEAGGVSLKGDDKSPAGTMGLGNTRRG